MSYRTLCLFLLCSLMLAGCSTLAGDPPIAGTPGMEMSAQAMSNMEMTSGTMAADAVEPVTSEAGLYRVTARSRMDPVVINEIHEWTLEVATIDGAPVQNALIRVDGGMPTHNHGLPTAPEVTNELEPGLYLLEGVRFNMGGAWVLDFEIEADAGTDRAQIEFELK